MALFRFFAAHLACVMGACMVLAASPALANEVQAINQQFSTGDLPARWPAPMPISSSTPRMRRCVLSKA